MTRNDIKLLEAKKSWFLHGDGGSRHIEVSWTSTRTSTSSSWTQGWTQTSPSFSRTWHGPHRVLHGLKHGPQRVLHGLKTQTSTSLFFWRPFLFFEIFSHLGENIFIAMFDIIETNYSRLQLVDWNLACKTISNVHVRFFRSRSVNFKVKSLKSNFPDWTDELSSKFKKGIESWSTSVIFYQFRVLSIDKSNKNNKLSELKKIT